MGIQWRHEHHGDFGGSEGGEMKPLQSKFIGYNLIFSVAIIATAALIPERIERHDFAAYIMGWVAFFLYFLISCFTLKKGGLVIPLIWSLGWFLVTMIAAVIVGRICMPRGLGI